jgi:transposase
MAARRHALTDEQWARIEDLFPKNGKRGGQWKDHRTMLDAMLWVLKTGAPWRDLPERFGPWKTASERFRRWTRDGLWDKALERLQLEEPTLDLTLVCIDGSSVRAHRHAAGARKKGAQASRATTLSGAAEAAGEPRSISSATARDAPSRRP